MCCRFSAAVAGAVSVPMGASATGCAGITTSQHIYWSMLQVRGQSASQLHPGRLPGCCTARTAHTLHGSAAVLAHTPSCAALPVCAPQTWVAAAGITAGAPRGCQLSHVTTIRKNMQQQQQQQQQHMQHADTAENSTSPNPRQLHCWPRSCTDGFAHTPAASMLT
jgi:hypothetical protein